MQAARFAMLSAAFFIILSGSVSAETFTLGWFGNSYSEGGWQHKELDRMYNCDTCGFTSPDSLAITIWWYPSCWLDCHETRWPAFTVIDTGHYDYILAQDGLWANTSTAGLVPRAQQLTRWADHAKSAGGKLLIEQMWIPVNPAATEIMQDVSDFWYDSVATATNSILIPSGHAWWYARKERPGLEYSSLGWNDGNHPGSAGAYINSCCMYAALTGRSPVGLKIRSIDYYDDDSGGIYMHHFSDSDALLMQTKSWEAYQFFRTTTARLRSERRDAAVPGTGDVICRYIRKSRTLEVFGRELCDVRLSALDGSVIPVTSTVAAPGKMQLTFRNEPVAGVYLVQVQYAHLRRTTTLTFQ